MHCIKLKRKDEHSASSPRTHSVLKLSTLTIEYHVLLTISEFSVQFRNALKVVFYFFTRIMDTESLACVSEWLETYAVVGFREASLTKSISLYKQREF